MDNEHDIVERLIKEGVKSQTGDVARPPTPIGWSDTDWIKHLQEHQNAAHPLAGLHINQGSMDAAADAYEAEYKAECLNGGEHRYKERKLYGTGEPLIRWRCEDCGHEVSNACGEPGGTN